MRSAASGAYSASTVVVKQQSEILSPELQRFVAYKISMSTLFVAISQIFASHGF